jgi:hypothetical protein
MKRNVLLICILMSACHVEENAAVAPIVDNFDTSKATLLVQGNLQGIGHTASGVASVYKLDDTYAVVLDPYASQNGPDLKVYLSKDRDASEYVRLGNLKSTMGKQTYLVPAGINVAQFGFVHVWCEKYTVVFARAELQ